MNSKNPHHPIDDRPTLVVDLTYLCNFGCRYCQWGNPNSDGRVHRAVDELNLPTETLEALGVQRVVFSGGEPELHPHFEDVIAHYAKYSPQVIAITNGLRMTERRVDELVSHGLTGLSFSLDALDPEIAYQTRGMSPSHLERVVTHLEQASQRKHTSGTGFEVGLNVVVSSANCSVAATKHLLEFADEHCLDFVKFQPLFDDGYVSRNAPDLMLCSSHAAELEEISSYIKGRSRNSTPTNGVDFWRTLARVQQGSRLKGTSCGLDARQSILIRNKLKFCFWVDHPIYGDTSTKLARDEVNDTRRQFHHAKASCETGPHCFCLQSLNHRWEVEGHEH